MAGVWEMQDHIDGLADVEENPKGLQRGLAGLSAVTEQRAKLQVSSDCGSIKLHQILALSLAAGAKCSNARIAA